MSRSQRLVTEEISERISACAERHGERVAAIYLFGSWAKETAGPLSDLDLAILFDPRERPHFLELRCALYADFSRALETNDIDLTVLNSLDNLVVLEEILRQGKVLFDGNPELRHDFEQKALHRAIDFRQQRLRVMGV